LNGHPRVPNVVRRTPPPPPRRWSLKSSCPPPRPRPVRTPAGGLPDPAGPRDRGRFLREYTKSRAPNCHEWESMKWRTTVCTPDVDGPRRRSLLSNPGTRLETGEIAVCRFSGTPWPNRAGSKENAVVGWSSVLRGPPSFCTKSVPEPGLFGYVHLPLFTTGRVPDTLFWCKGRPHPAWPSAVGNS